MNIARIPIVLMLTLPACATIPPNGISHARFVRSDAPGGVKAGFSAAAAVSEESVTIPVADGTVAWQWSDRMDGSVVAHDGIAHYEGLFRFTPRFGLLHGIGLGFPALTDDAQILGGAASVGLFGQLGPSFFAAATYAPFYYYVSEDDSRAVHFVNAELGWSFGTRVQLAPAITVAYVANAVDGSHPLPLLGLASFTVMASP